MGKAGHLSSHTWPAQTQVHADQPSPHLHTFHTSLTDTWALTWAPPLPSAART